MFFRGGSGSGRGVTSSDEASVVSNVSATTEPEFDYVREDVERQSVVHYEESPLASHGHPSNLEVQIVGRTIVSEGRRRYVSYTLSLPVRLHQSSPDGEIITTLETRFSVIYLLRKVLLAKFPPRSDQPPLPSLGAKTFAGNLTNRVVNERIIAINNFLSVVQKHPDMVNSKYWERFLQGKKVTMKNEKQLASIEVVDPISPSLPSAPIDLIAEKFLLPGMKARHTRLVYKTASDNYLRDLAIATDRGCGGVDTNRLVLKQTGGKKKIIEMLDKFGHEYTQSNCSCLCDLNRRPRMMEKARRLVIFYILLDLFFFVVAAATMRTNPLGVFMFVLCVMMTWHILYYVEKGLQPFRANPKMRPVAGICGFSLFTVVTFAVAVSQKDPESADSYDPDDYDPDDTSQPNPAIYPVFVMLTAIGLLMVAKFAKKAHSLFFPGCSCPFSISDILKCLLNCIYRPFVFDDSEQFMSYLNSVFHGLAFDEEGNTEDFALSSAYMDASRKGLQARLRNNLLATSNYSTYNKWGWDPKDQFSTVNPEIRARDTSLMSSLFRLTSLDEVKELAAKNASDPMKDLDGSAASLDILKQEQALALEYRQLVDIRVMKVIVKRLERFMSRGDTSFRDLTPQSLDMSAYERQLGALYKILFKPQTRTKLGSFAFADEIAKAMETEPLAISMRAKANDKIASKLKGRKNNKPISDLFGIRFFLSEEAFDDHWLKVPGAIKKLVDDNVAVGCVHKLTENVYKKGTKEETFWLGSKIFVGVETEAGVVSVEVQFTTYQQNILSESANTHQLHDEETHGMGKR